MFWFFFSQLLGSFLLSAFLTDCFLSLLHSLACVCQPLAITTFALEELCESICFLWAIAYQCLITDNWGGKAVPLHFFLLFLSVGKPQMIWIRLCAFCSCPLNDHVVLYINYNQKNAIYLYWLNWNNSASSLEVLVPHHLLSSCLNCWVAVLKLQLQLWEVFFFQISK